LYVGASEYALPFFEHKGFTKVRRNEFEKRGVPMHNYTMEKLLQQPVVNKFWGIPAVNYR
jgi:putative acetyltransferase